MASGSEPTSLEARISKPEITETTVTSAVNSDPKEPTTADVENENAKPTEKKPEESTLPKAQTDGAAELGGGNTGIYEPDYDVEIKLSDAQADPNNPLFSVKTFEELGL